MLATEKESTIAITPYQLVCTSITKDKIFNKGVYGGIDINPQHLYITSSDEIKEDDWCIHTHKNLPENTQLRKNIYGTIGSVIGRKEYVALYCKKIIATTDPELHKDGVAKIGLPFIEKYITEYNKGMMIKEVNVEYMDFCDYEGEELRDITADWRPKLRSDGTIIIHKIQEVFTKEDLLTAYKAGYFWNGAHPQFDTWFEQNY